MKYFIYKTTNILNSKYYIGCHQTKNLDDGYLGSGKLLRKAIRKYGKENFKFEILCYAETKEEMFTLEKEFVTENLVKDPLSYNLKLGGSGGNPGIVGAFLGKKHSQQTKEKQRLASLQQVTSEEKRKKLSENNWARRDPEAHKKHVTTLGRMKKSEEHKQNLRNASLLNKSGIKNKGKVRKKVVCPSCGKEGAMNTMSRFHFDNCKKITQ